MFKRVMWATDGSEAANRAMPIARTLAAESGPPVLVVY
jgi:nucleotide-binding universal stress UspA family protein